ncbi:MAG: csa1 [Peptococcaceae bacterium]|jgi:CRISPR-associated protein Csa1|nr:csa1 [Peptococcaceae bacterium]
MYFLTDEERKQLLKSYLPKSRQMDIADELRGWNWNQPPLEPIYDIKLALYEIANSYCPTNRDLFLRRIDGVKARPNAAMLRGKLLHQVLVDVLVRAKKLIYLHGVGNYQEILQEHKIPLKINFEQYRSQLSEEEFSSLARDAEILANFETSRIVARIQEILIKQPYIAEDSLVSLAIPVVVEQKLDGSFLGLSQNLSADAFTFSEPMIIDLKFGEPKKFHRLTTTGYALVMEAIHEFPVNLGCLVYAEFKNGRLSVKKDIHIIDDELRQWFIEERDEKMRMIYEEIDPGIAQNCYDTCPYYRNCHG